MKNPLDNPWRCHRGQRPDGRHTKYIRDKVQCVSTKTFIYDHKINRWRRQRVFAVKSRQQTETDSQIRCNVFKSKTMEKPKWRKQMLGELKSPVTIKDTCGQLSVSRQTTSSTLKDGLENYKREANEYLIDESNSSQFSVNAQYVVLPVPVLKSTCSSYDVTQFVNNEQHSLKCVSEVHCNSCGILHQAKPAILCLDKDLMTPDYSQDMSILKLSLDKQHGPVYRRRRKGVDLLKRHSFSGCFGCFSKINLEGELLNKLNVLE